MGTWAQRLSGKRAASVVGNEGIEQIELRRPWEAVEHAGGRPVLAATKEGQAQAPAFGRAYREALLVPNLSSPAVRARSGLGRFGVVGSKDGPQLSCPVFYRGEQLDSGGEVDGVVAEALIKRASRVTWAATGGDITALVATSFVSRS